MVQIARRLRMLEWLIDGLSEALDRFTDEACDELQSAPFAAVKSAYESALDILRLTPMNPDRAALRLDDAFATCDHRFMFVYDHIKECVRRNAVLEYQEYSYLSKRFPRIR